MRGVSPIAVDRRTFLKMGASALLASAVSHPALAAIAPHKHAYHVLSFYNIHTGETLTTAYRDNGRLIRPAVASISHILRDYRTGEVKPMDPKLLDLLHRLVSEISPREPISVISGYRSPRTNAALRRVTTGVAKYSLHVEGRAIDIRIPGQPTAELRQMAIGLKSGGVGYYPKSDFLHLDTGPVKVW